MDGRFFNIIRRFQDRPKVGATPADVVHAENKWRLLRYRSEQRSGVPILLIPSLINRHYVLDLMPGKSFAEYLVAQGHDVFIIDWGTPEKEDRFLTFEDIVLGYIGRAVRKAASYSPTGKTHLLGYCLGGTLATIYTALEGDKVESMVNLAAPIRFNDDGMLSAFSKIPTLNLELMVKAFGNVPWPLMQFGFHLLKPTLNMSKAVYMLEKAWDDQFLDGFFAIETWGNDNVSFPGAVFLKYIKELYQEDLLHKGEFYLDGRQVDLHNINCPLLNITFEHDHIVPWKSAAVLNELVGTDEPDLMHMRGGHVGAVVSRKASKGLWPDISNWYRGHEPSANLRLA